MFGDICFVLLFVILIVILAMIVFHSMRKISFSCDITQFFGGGQSKGDIVADYDVAKIHTKIVRTMANDTSKPTVIFIAGLGNSLDWWNWNEAPEELIQKTKWPRNSGIQDPVSKIANTLSFDMPGTGKSYIDYPTAHPEESITPTSLRSVAIMIDNLAKYHKMPTPYILVAHSIGGMIARVYQNMYPDKVSGMILLDPSPDFIVRNIPPPGDYSALPLDVRLRKLVIENYMTGYRDNFDRDVISKGINDNIIDPEHTIVHYNIQPKLDDNVQFEEYMLKRFKNVVRHYDRAHHIHILEPESVIKSITEIVNQIS